MIARLPEKLQSTTLTAETWGGLRDDLVTFGPELDFLFHF